MNNTELKKIRLKLDLTQSSLAQYLETPLSTYIKWENGTSRIPGMIKVALEAVKMKVTEHSKKEGFSRLKNR